MIPSTNIYLVGPMGAGKSSIGKQFANKTSRKFIDSDTEIEKRTGVRIDLIFEIEGESGFRKREAQMIDELTILRDVVLATGGGAVLLESNREKLKQNGTVIYLRASPKLLMKRTAKDRDRPLLRTENRLQRIKELLELREPLYEEVADFIIDTDGHTVRKIVKQIQEITGIDA